MIRGKDWDTMLKSERTISWIAITSCLAAAGCAARDAVKPVPQDANAVATGCAGDNAELSLPMGFCASVFADNLLHARGVVVASNGDVYVTIEGTVPSPEARATRPRGSFVALRDTNDDGKADVIERVGTTGNTGIGIFNGYLYVDEGHDIVRYARADSQLVPSGREVVLGGIPLVQHLAHSFEFGRDSSLFVNVGSPSNSCQLRDRERGSPGKDPCGELDSTAGIWRYRADKPNQAFSASNRFVTGLRNGMALAVSADGKLYAIPHGRDQLHDTWPATFPKATYEANNPGEEFVELTQGDDFGWPYCYYAMDKKQLVDAPEYGGDGIRNSRCTDKKEPIASFPAHWAPMSMMFYDGAAFPEKYRHGVFVAFHGSLKRPPRTDAGYRIVFQPFVNGAPSGPFEVFAVGFARPGRGDEATEVLHRPTGLAVSPDGAIFVTDDNGGRIYKITYRGR
jgi:glucose/arabinose dehydrogenase